MLRDNTALGQPSDGDNRSPAAVRADGHTGTDSVLMSSLSKRPEPRGQTRAIKSLQSHGQIMKSVGNSGEWQLGP